MVIQPPSDSTPPLIGNCTLNDAGAAFMAARQSPSSNIRECVELYIMEVGDIEWTPNEFIAWVRERSSPAATQQFDQANTTSGDTVGNRFGGNIGRSISQRLAESTNPNSAMYQNIPIHRVARGRYQVLEAEIENIIQRQQHLVQASNESNTATQPSNEENEQINQSATPSPLVVLPPEVLSHLSENASEESSENSSSESNPPAEFGYLYLAYNQRSFSGWVKAGYSTEQNRIDNYQTGDPHRLYRPIAYAAIQATEGMTLLQLETQFHTMILPHMTARGTPSQTRNSEWFRISHVRAIQVLNELHPESFFMAPDYVGLEEE
jgi:hypothetical protein|tara:strand:- start:167 stop:1132 length:966 start_codon:yes stop_codon:yes gene_type:complete